MDKSRNNIFKALNGAPDKDERTTQQKFDDEEYENRQQDRKLRKVFSFSTFALICVFLLSVIVLLFLCGFGVTVLSDTVLSVLLGTTTTTVLGLFVIVAKYLFHNHFVSEN